MTNELPFTEFQKIARLSRECVITEKLDGTNAQIEIFELTNEAHARHYHAGRPYIHMDDKYVVYAGSRTKYITPADDNYGFARWAVDHVDELLALGAGRHFGEWWGLGIQRKYNVPEKRFSLFNTGRWLDPHVEQKACDIPADKTSKRQYAPDCCHVVPIIRSGLFTTDLVEDAMKSLKVGGSYAAPDFDKPEGIVIYHTAAGIYFKKTLAKDEEWKGKK
jgi:hypothetical protein